MQAIAQFEREKNLVTRTIAGETIIVPISDRVCDLDSIYTLNEVGTAIWRRVDGRTSVREIVDSLTEEFEVDRGAAEGDVEEFLTELAARELIRPAS